MKKHHIIILIFLVLAANICTVHASELSERGEAQLGLAETYIATGKYAEAEKILTELQKEYPDSKEIKVNLAMALGYGKKPEKAIIVLSELQKSYPDDSRVDEVFASVMESNQRFDEAEEIYAKMLQEDPENKEMLVRVAELNSWTGDYDTAKEKYRILLEKYPDDRKIVLGMGDVCSWGGEYGEAIVYYEKAEISPESDAHRYQSLADAYALSGSPEEALELYEELIRMYPDDLKIKVASMSMLYALGRDEEAATKKQALLESAGDDVDLLMKIAEALALRQRYPEAIEVLEVAIEIDPENKEARLYLARFYGWGTEYGKSVEAYDEIIEKYPDWILPRREKGRVLGWSREYKKAIEAYSSIYEDIGPDEFSSLEMRAKEDFYKGYDYQAIREYKEWLEAEPNDQEALFDLGQVYSREMQWSNAKKTYARLLRLLPGHFRARQALDKVEVLASSTRIKTGYEHYEGDSASRDIDERYNRIYSSLRQPINENLYLNLDEDTIFYASRDFSQVIRQKIRAGFEYYMNPMFWLKGGYTYNIYSRGIKDNHNFDGEITFKPYDMITGKISYKRKDITDNGQTILRKLRSDDYGARLEIEPNRRIKAGGDFTFSGYTDNNNRKMYGFDAEGTILYEPKRLKVFYRYEEYMFNSPRDFYFTPSSFHTNRLGVEWRQHLNEDEIFWGINETYFTCRYSVNFDVKDQVGHTLYFDFHKDWTERLSTHVEWVKMIYDHRNTYGEERVNAYVKIDF